MKPKVRKLAVIVGVSAPPEGSAPSAGTGSGGTTTSSSSTSSGTAA